MDDLASYMTVWVTVSTAIYSTTMFIGQTKPSRNIYYILKKYLDWYHRIFKVKKVFGKLIPSFSRSALFSCVWLLIIFSAVFLNNLRTSSDNKDIESAIIFIRFIVLDDQIWPMILALFFLALVLNVIFDYISIVKSYRIGFYLRRSEKKSLLNLSIFLLLEIIISAALAFGVVQSWFVLGQFVLDKLPDAHSGGFSKLFFLFVMHAFSWNDGGLALLFMVPAFLTTLLTSIWIFLFIFAHILIWMLRWAENSLTKNNGGEESIRDARFVAGAMVAIFSILFFSFA